MMLLSIIWGALNHLKDIKFYVSNTLIDRPIKELVKEIQFLSDKASKKQFKK